MTRDLSGRWRQILDRSLARAVEALPELGEWRPGDEAGRVLFDRLAVADSIIGRSVCIPAGSVRELAFSPDLTEIALIPYVEKPPRMEIYAVADGRLLDRRPLSATELEAFDHTVVHLGGSIVHLERHESDEGGWHWKLVRRRPPEWTPDVLDEFTTGKTMLAPMPGGFVVVAPKFFLFGTADGPLRRTDVAEGWTDLLTTDPASGRMAVIVGDDSSTYAQKELRVLDADLRVIASAPIGDEQKHVYNEGGWFCGPDRLLTLGTWNHLKSWQVTDGELVLQRSRHLDKWEHRYAAHLHPLGTTPFPASMTVAVERNVDPPLWLDARTVGEVKAPFWGSTCPIWVSSGGEHVVFSSTKGIEIRDLRMLELADTPMAQLSAADLVGDGEVVALLKACLEYRST